MFSPSLCNNHHTKSVIRPTATPGSCSVRYGTCLNPRARSLPQFPTTMQIHSARDRSQYPSSCARAAALKEGEDTKQKKSFRFKWKYHHHSPWKKKKTSGKLFPRTCISQCQVVAGNSCSVNHLQEDHRSRRGWCCHLLQMNST